MASIRIKERGSWLARWRNSNGELIEKSTGLFQRDDAQRRANQMEAESRFWEDVPNFQTYAALGYSPQYCHDSFIASKHLRLDYFKKLLAEAGIVFLKASQWRDVKKPSNRGKKYKYCGKMLTVSEILHESESTISAQTLHYRLGKGWPVEDAVLTPLISPVDSGRKGAHVTNAKRR